jgi:enoyl-CoA hydratase
MIDDPTVSYDADGAIAVVTIERPAARNAVNRTTAQALASAFRRFDTDASVSVAILTGRNGAFCAGFDLKETAAGRRGHRTESGDAPMGPTRLTLSKPVIAAVEGPAVAGGLELALWCDLRVAARDSVFGVYCRRFGVPLMDLGTIRLPRLIGHSRAMDLILTGRGISGEEAERIGLVNRVVEPGQALAAARQIAEALARLPQAALEL